MKVGEATAEDYKRMGDIYRETAGQGGYAGIDGGGYAGIDDGSVYPLSSDQAYGGQWTSEMENAAIKAGMEPTAAQNAFNTGQT
jgi:hypothetical protein